MDAVKLQLSIINQMCHLDILLLRKNTKDGNSVDDEIVSFNSALKEVVVCASKYRFI